LFCGRNLRIHQGMKNERFNSSVRRDLNSSRLVGASQPLHGTQSLKVAFSKTTPLQWLVEVRGRRPNRIALPAISRQSLLPGGREKLATLRAAELAAWEATGGDYLRAE
jgi:hypothetical protein